MEKPRKTMRNHREKNIVVNLKPWNKHWNIINNRRKKHGKPEINT
jgi:hypothetical protein